MNTKPDAYPPEIVSNYHIDLWEHASKLFRLLHWQQAVEIFEFLAKDVPGPKESTKCLVNKALVEARLGDYNRAALTTADAAELGEDLPITAFLAGLINYELSQLNLAEAWFEACLTGMNGQDIDYSEDRLQFVLEHAAVQHNLESASQARLAHELGFEDAAADGLEYLPANLLFETPPRSREPSPAANASALWFNSEPSDRRTTSSTAPKAAAESRKCLSRVPSSAYSAASISQESSAPLIAEEICDSPDKTFFEQNISPLPVFQPAPKRTYTPLVVRPGAALNSPAQTSPATTPNARELRSLERIRQREAAIHTSDGELPAVPRAKIPYTWHGQQRRRFEPRDARGVSDSVKELAHFVQEFAPEGAAPVRKIMTEDTRAKMTLRAGEAATAEIDIDFESDEELFMPVGATPKTKRKDHLETAQRRRAVTLETSADRSPIRRSTTPNRNRSLLKGLVSPKDGVLKAPRKPIKVRWPFQDDHEEPEPEAPTSAEPVGLKPVPLDFIMGTDGKTIVIEKAPKTAPSMTQALQQVQEARWHDPHNRRHDPISPVATSDDVGKETSREQPTELPLLQPTVYESPAWRKRKQVPTRQETTSPVRLESQGNDHLSPPPQDVPKRKPATPLQSPSSPEARTPTPPQRSVSRYSPSIVSSINMWDYILDKDRA